MDSYKKGQISVLDYYKSIAANIEVTQYIDVDLAIDYNEESGSSNDVRKSAESLPEIENVTTLSAETSTCVNYE